MLKSPINWEKPVNLMVEDSEMKLAGLRLQLSKISNELFINIYVLPDNDMFRLTIDIPVYLEVHKRPLILETLKQSPLTILLP